jgi:hypothetical protein
MATPLSADRLLAALKAEGVLVREYRNWRDHERDDETGRPFGPVKGLVIHHTAGRDSLALCYDGRSDLPGPLCHTHLAKDGTASMISAGRTNHCGSMARNAYDAMVAESPVHPRPDASEPIDGNDVAYGLEIENLGNGTDPYPDVQYDQAVRWAAAICRAHGWSADSAIGHKEATRRKIDPSFDMDAFREAVAERLAYSASWSPGVTTPKPPEQEDDMPLSNADVRKVWTADGIVPAPGDDPDNPYWLPATYLRATYNRSRRVEAMVAALTAQVGALTATITTLAQGGGLSAAEIKAAAEAGASAALDQLGEALTED